MSVVRRRKSKVLPLYLVTGIVAGGLILFSAFAPHGDGHDHGGLGSHDGGFDVDHAPGAPNAADAFLSWLPFGNFRFWLYFLGIFGLMGSTLTLTGMAKEPLILTSSLITGFITGFVVAVLVNLLQKRAQGESIGEDDFIGVQGRLLVAIRPGQAGKVRVMVKGELIDYIAESDIEDTIEVDEAVLIVGVHGNRVKVARLNDFLAEEAELSSSS